MVNQSYINIYSGVTVRIPAFFTLLECADEGAFHKDSLKWIINHVVVVSQELNRKPLPNP